MDRLLPILIFLLAAVMWRTAAKEPDRLLAGVLRLMAFVVIGLMVAVLFHQ